jgi:hypothetical protein
MEDMKRSKKTKADIKKSIQRSIRKFGDPQGKKRKALEEVT